MHRIDLCDIPLDEVRIEDDETANWLVSFPFTGDAPGETKTESDSLSVVYNELEPGKRLGFHRDGTDEVLLVLDGTIEVTIGEETDTAGSKGLVLIPAGTRHSVRNIGTETARLIGCFGEGKVESAFEGVVAPPDEGA